MTTSTNKDAINAALELFHRRWVLRILWELRVGAMTFRGLQSACSEVSPTVLNQRLADLREAGLVEHEQGSGYHLTDEGKALLVAFEPLSRWAVRWWKKRLPPDTSEDSGPSALQEAMEAIEDPGAGKNDED